MMTVFQKIMRLLFPRRVVVYQPLPTFVANDVHDMADAVIFSHDRPMQLYAYLESIQKYVTGLRDTLVIYRTSDSDFERGYQVVQQAFPQVKFYQQTTVESFKPLLLHVLFSVSTCSHFLFGVDDIIMTDFINLRDCIAVMDQSCAYGFYLRLGKNITQNYTIKEYRNKTYPLPPLREVTPGFFTWRFDQAQLPDWRSCQSFDMTIFRKQDVRDSFFKLDYTTLNTFERDFFKHADMTKYGVCCEYSKMVNIPLNLVQERKRERNMNFMQPKELLKSFEQGSRIDIASFYRINNNAPHMEYVPRFVASEKVNH
jgi:hypothetical protein